MINCSDDSLIAEPLYLVRYIEKAGSGTLDMIERCNDAGLPSPDFEERSGQFVTTLWRDWLTEEVMSNFDLNERQKQAIAYLKINGSIGNTEYQSNFSVAKRTAHRDLSALMNMGVIERFGITGKGTIYKLRKGAIKGPKGPRLLDSHCPVGTCI